MIPELEPHCGSWIVARGDHPLFETFDRARAERAYANGGVTVYTAYQWLVRLNMHIRDTSKGL